MLLIGFWKPNQKIWTLAQNDEVDMTPWEYAYATPIWLIAAIVILYLTFSKIGLVDGIGMSYYLSLGVVVLIAGIGSW